MRTTISSAYMLCIHDTWYTVRGKPVCLDFVVKKIGCSTFKFCSSAESSYIALRFITFPTVAILTTLFHWICSWYFYSFRRNIFLFAIFNRFIWAGNDAIMNKFICIIRFQPVPLLRKMVARKSGSGSEWSGKGIRKAVERKVIQFAGDAADTF